MSVLEKENGLHQEFPIQDEKNQALQPNEHNDEIADWDIISPTEANESSTCTLPCCYTVASVRVGEEKYRYIRANCTHWKAGQQQRTVEFVASSAAEALAELEKLDKDGEIEMLRLRRPVSVRFMDVRGWRVLLEQLRVEVGKFEGLRGLEIVMPDVEGLTEVEGERKRELERVDEALRAAVKYRD